jgi:hypothetical protein
MPGRCGHERHVIAQLAACARQVLDYPFAGSSGIRSKWWSGSYATIGNENRRALAGRMWPLNPTRPSVQSTLYCARHHNCRNTSIPAEPPSLSKNGAKINAGRSPSRVAAQTRSRATAREHEQRPANARRGERRAGAQQSRICATVRDLVFELCNLTPELH